MKITLMYCIIIFVFICCKKENEQNNFIVSGKISNIESISSTVQLSLSNNQDTYTATTTLHGDYEFKDIPAGEYLLKVSQNKIKGEVERNQKVIVSNKDLNIDIILSDPVELFCTSHPANSVTLNWTQSIDSGFREYKIYKGYNSGIDEITGTLINVSTVRTDTSFIDTSYAMNGVEPNSNYYYRIFVMDEYGKIAGSNVLHVKTDSLIYLYSLNMSANFATNNFGLVSGVANDGQFIWLVYRLNIGGFYDNDKITLAKYNLINFNLVDTFSFNDRYEPIGGLTFDGLYLWLQYSASGTGSNFIRKIDPANKNILNEYNTDYGVSGISFFNSTLYLNYYYAKTELLNPNTGALLNTFHIPSSGNNDFGIAVRSNEVWISERLGNGSENNCFILNNDFTLKGFINIPFDFPHICFYNNQLIVATTNRIYIYDIL